MELFSSPFDTSAVDFLEKLDVPAYKIASFEITDHILIKRIAETKKPVIISSGMASKEELGEAVELLRKHGCPNICMLKCTSAYPAKPDDANLVTMKDMAESFNVIPGLSDHTLGIEVPVTSVALGAKVIEKHFTLSRSSGSPDDAFSLTPDEFKLMVDTVRIVEKTIGTVIYGGVKSEEECKKFRRSLFACKNIKKGESFTSENIRSIRPGNGLHTKYYEEILSKRAKNDIEFGEPLKWDDME
jgi:pseudaminic acid synthase